jgi:Ca-activated chloride channel family protein
MPKFRLIQSALMLVLMLVVHVIAVAAFNDPARSQEPPTALIISDTSGSMEGYLGAERKRLRYEIARDGLKASLAKAGAGSRLGLIAFGHRQKGCSDVELIVPPEAGPAERVLGPLERIKPIGGRGTGPLALALREAG